MGYVFCMSNTFNGLLYNIHIDLRSIICYQHSCGAATASSTKLGHEFGLMLHLRHTMTQPHPAISFSTPPSAYGLAHRLSKIWRMVHPPHFRCDHNSSVAWHTPNKSFGLPALPWNFLWLRHSTGRN